MHRATPVIAALLLGVFAASAAHAEAGTNADICASSGDAYTPQQQIAACSALIDSLKDQPQALAAALVNRGATYWYINQTQAALDDLDRAIALDPGNARAFRERANTYRTLRRLDPPLAHTNPA